jgi:hypothetical protein
MLMSLLCRCRSILGRDIRYAVRNAPTEVRFIIDRNMYSHVLALAKGAVVTEKTKLAAAVMAFASCANAQIEPNLAIYEGSASGATGGWRRNLGLFYRAEEIHAGNWASLALGYSPRFNGRIPSRRIPTHLSKQFNPQSSLSCCRAMRYSINSSEQGISRLHLAKCASTFRINVVSKYPRALWMGSAWEAREAAFTESWIRPAAVDLHPISRRR